MVRLQIWIPSFLLLLGPLLTGVIVLVRVSSITQKYLWDIVFIGFEVHWYIGIITEREVFAGFKIL